MATTEWVLHAPRCGDSRKDRFIAPTGHRRDSKKAYRGRVGPIPTAKAKETTPSQAHKIAGFEKFKHYGHFRDAGQSSLSSHASDASSAAGRSSGGRQRI